MEDYKKAHSLYGTSLSTISSNIGKDNMYFATLLTYQGKLYHDQINYNKAESLHKESLDILQKLQDINPLHIAQSMTNLGKLYHDIGNLRDAEIYLKNALEIREKLLGENHLDSAQSKNDLAEVYLNIGDYSKAEEYHKQALEIRVKIFSRLKNTPEGLNNLAYVHHQLGNNSEAIKLYKKSLGMWKKIGQKKSSGYASALHNLGELYYELREFSKSEKYFNQALKIRQLIFDRDISPPVAQSMTSLALLYQKMHEYVKAEEYYKQALNILKKVFGEKNINLAITLNNLAMLYAETQRQDKAIDLVKDVITIEDELIGKVFSIGSERQRMAFLNIINKNFHNFLSLTNQYFSNSKEEIKYAVNLTIRRKGIGAEVLTATRDAVLSGKYPEMESKLRELNIIRKQIARKALDGKDENEMLETHNKILEEWNNRKENLEEELANHIPEIGLEQKLKASSLETISKYLSIDTVLIELVKFNFTDFSNQSNNDVENNKRSHYLAFVIYGNTIKDIQMFDLGDSELIDDKINKFRNSVTGENQNRNLILVGSYPKSFTSNSQDMEDLFVNLNPLIKVIENYKKIFIAPDGDFTKFPFELLRFDSSPKYILEECLIGYITTSRDLIIFNNSSITNESHNNSLVIADPDFDLSTSDIQNNNIPTNSIFSSAIPQSNSQNNKSIFRQSRDFDSRSLNFSRLKGTREEGQVIAELIGVTPCMDQKVLESEIKSQTSPNILHIATHGFFLPNQKNRNTANIMNIAIMETNPFSRLSGDNLDNPMLRSGLALAGVNTWLKNRPLIKEAEDGILTAEDVAGWNLFNTELVVLSACETGLGDIVTGEGVFGLRRAFVLAGAQTLVMSLWKVPDEQTKELMVNFYKYLLAGKPRAEALREAQLSMKEKYPNPYYWGAFICQGNPAPLSKNFCQNS
jgi:CHAT domain-containing protein/Tfp pilus assembly protein PilF